MGSGGVFVFMYNAVQILNLYIPMAYCTDDGLMHYFQVSATVTPC